MQAEAAKQGTRQGAEPRDDYPRPLGATPFLMDGEAAEIVLGGKLFEGDNLFKVASSIVREDQKRILAEDRAREAAIVAEAEPGSTDIGRAALAVAAARRGVRLADMTESLAT